MEWPSSCASVPRLTAVPSKLMTMNGCVPGRARREGTSHLALGRVDVDPALVQAGPPHRADVLVPERSQRVADPLHALLVVELDRLAAERRPDVVRLEGVETQHVAPQAEVPVPRGQVCLKRLDQVVEHAHRQVGAGERRLECRAVPTDARREDVLLDGAREVRRERIAESDVPVCVALPGAST